MSAPPDPLAAFLAGLGAQVRTRREAAGLSRRALAERAGLSQRYLAQLEAGQGNISVGLLYRVAQALAVPLERLVATAPAPSRRIALIGLRGAGKSTLGRRAADRLGLPFLELTALVEESTGMPAGEAISLYGEDGYRLSEREAIARLIDRHQAAIVAVGGGIVEHPETFELLLENFRTVWIRARPEEHMQRVRAQGDLRPMRGVADAMARLRAILARRAAQYARADLTVDTSGASIEQSLSALLTALGEAPEPAPPAPSA